VQAQLRRAVQLVIEQQQHLEKLHEVVERQNKYISKLCRRDVTLGLELRQSPGILDKHAWSDTPSQPAATGKMLLVVH